MVLQQISQTPDSANCVPIFKVDVFAYLLGNKSILSTSVVFETECPVCVRVLPGLAAFMRKEILVRFLIRENR
jgi:hypothetical protein